jgi:hypothetical protein
MHEIFSEFYYTICGVAVVKGRGIFYMQGVGQSSNLLYNPCGKIDFGVFLLFTLLL